MTREEQIEATIVAHVEAWLAAGKKLVTTAKRREIVDGVACPLYSLPEVGGCRNGGDFVDRAGAIGMIENEAWDFISGFDHASPHHSSRDQPFFKMGDRLAHRFGVRS